MMSNKVTPQMLLSAYSQGYFPMPDQQNQELLWYRPDPRAIIPLENFHVARSLKKSLRNDFFIPTFNQNFAGIMDLCADREETWINTEIKKLYTELHDLGFAQSVEIWQHGKIVGGVYGVNLGKAFFAESMFHKVTNASKVALYYLVEYLKKLNFKLLECQFITDHLASLGAIAISDEEYQKLLIHALR